MSKFNYHFLSFILLLIILQSLDIGSCAKAGYTKCCIPSDSEKCLGHPETCHCDLVCHEYGDCCADVVDIGCVPTTGSCVATGRTKCCLSDDPDCTGMPANCMCDQACYERGDCCGDISSLENCKVDPGKGIKNFCVIILYDYKNKINMIIVPSAVNNLMVISSSDSSLMATWDTPDTPNGANTYTIVVKNYTKEVDFKPWIISLSIYTNQHTIDGLSKIRCGMLTTIL